MSRLIFSTVAIILASFAVPAQATLSFEIPREQYHRPFDYGKLANQHILRDLKTAIIHDCRIPISTGDRGCIDAVVNIEYAFNADDEGKRRWYLLKAASSLEQYPVLQDIVLQVMRMVMRQ